MDWSMKRLSMALVGIVALPIIFGSCHKKTASPILCKNDADCRFDAVGHEINGVCAMGKCEECQKDSDCPDTKRCIDYRCKSACHADADCELGRHCEHELCIADCLGDEMCPQGHQCKEGHCVSHAGSEQDTAAWKEPGGCEGIERIHFDFDRYNVKSEYYGHIEHLAKCLEANPEFSVVIV